MYTGFSQFCFFISFTQFVDSPSPLPPLTPALVSFEPLSDIPFFDVIDIYTEDILLSILFHLPVACVVSLSMTSKSWNKLCDSNLLWKNFCERDYADEKVLPSLSLPPLPPSLLPPSSPL
jgi:hypothetical protein